MSKPRVGSLFAGVEGFGQGLEEAGFEVAWQVEIDKDAVSVLERHYPNTLRVRDVREAGAHNLTTVDVITFGSPCQGFSVAGRGEGLEDARSGLFGEAVRIIRELRPAFAVWENVPGAFSANDGRDFGAVLAALAESGAVDIAWRVLDAQWFGVPQRRRRIFLVADFGAERAAQVLFEPEGSRRDSEACRAPWEGTPGDIEDGAGVFSIQNGARPREYSQGLGVARNISYTLDTFGEHAVGVLPDTVRSHPQSGSNSVGNLTIAAPLTAGSHPNSNMPGRRREDDENLVAVASADSASYGNGSPRGDGSDNLISLNWQHVASDWSANVSQTLSTTRTPADGGRAGMAVRRLTPRECERLMSWPDDWTRWRADGSEISDGPRYRMIGNGVVSNVARWIGERLIRVMRGEA